MIFPKASNDIFCFVPDGVVLRFDTYETVSPKKPSFPNPNIDLEKVWLVLEKIYSLSKKVAGTPVYSAVSPMGETTQVSPIRQMVSAAFWASSSCRNRPNTTEPLPVHAGAQCAQLFHPGGNLPDFGDVQDFLKPVAQTARHHFEPPGFQRPEHGGRFFRDCGALSACLKAWGVLTPMAGLHSKMLHAGRGAAE